MIKSLYLNGTQHREFPEKSWTKWGVNKLLTNLQDKGTVDRRPLCGRLRNAHTDKIVETVNDLVLSQEDKPLQIQSIIRILSSLLNTMLIVDKHCSLR